MYTRYDNVSTDQLPALRVASLGGTGILRVYNSSTFFVGYFKVLALLCHAMEGRG